MPFYMPGSKFNLNSKDSPWKRSYNNKRKALWENDPKYCENVSLNNLQLTTINNITSNLNQPKPQLKKQEKYKGRLLLDLIDMMIFDFLTGNRDRHSYGKIRYYSDQFFSSNFNSSTFLFLMIFAAISAKILSLYILIMVIMHFWSFSKHLFEFIFHCSCIASICEGRAFGQASYDDALTLLGISQCCVIRSSTLKALLRWGHSIVKYYSICMQFPLDFSFKSGPKPLSQLMRESMASDPAAPILWEAHLKALDRRVDTLLNVFRECIELNTVEDVLYGRDNFGERMNKFAQ